MLKMDHNYNTETRGDNLMRRKPVHINAQSSDVASLAIIMGDPGRAEALSRELEEARLVNKKRGYVIYTGKYRGSPVTVASHGIGGPSMLILVEELFMLGTKTFVRLGTAGSLNNNVLVGDLVLASGASYLPGTCGLSLYYDKVPPSTSADPSLLWQVYKRLEVEDFKTHIGPVFCSDSFYGENPDILSEASRLGALAVEMETAALYGVQHIRGYRSLSILIIANNPLDKNEKFLEPDMVNDIARRVFRILLDALVKKI